MRLKTPYIASLTQVTIKREGEYAIIEYVVKEQRFQSSLPIGRVLEDPPISTELSGRMRIS